MFQVFLGNTYAVIANSDLTTGFIYIGRNIYASIFTRKLNGICNKINQYIFKQLFIRKYLFVAFIMKLNFLVLFQKPFDFVD